MKTQEHLWLHFTRMGGYEAPIIVRRDGCYLEDKETRRSFTQAESEGFLRGYLSNRFFERGLICRSDDRGDPVVQISPPLVAGQAEFDEIAGTLGDVLEEAWKQLS
jgi:adenosylmethionine-8-amino-7-oxononanoate aminotransferase